MSFHSLYRAIISNLFVNTQNTYVPLIFPINMINKKMLFTYSQYLFYAFSPNEVKQNVCYYFQAEEREITVIV